MDFVKNLLDQITPHFSGTLSEALFYLQDCKAPYSNDLGVLYELLDEDDFSHAQLNRFNALAESINPVDQAVYLVFLYNRSLSLFGPVHYARKVKEEGYNPIVDVVIKELIDQTVKKKGYTKAAKEFLRQFLPVNCLPEFELEEQKELPSFEDSFFEQLTA